MDALLNELHPFDWVTNTKTNQTLQVLAIYIPKEDSPYPSITLHLQQPYGVKEIYWDKDDISHLRVATEKEIEHIYMAQKWRKLHRSVDEYKVGDILFHGEKGYMEVKDEEELENLMQEKGIRLICPVEMRFDRLLNKA